MGNCSGNGWGIAPVAARGSPALYTIRCAMALSCIHGERICPDPVKIRPRGGTEPVPRSHIPSRLSGRIEGPTVGNGGEQSGVSSHIPGRKADILRVSTVSSVPCLGTTPLIGRSSGRGRGAESRRGRRGCPGVRSYRPASGGASSGLPGAPPALLRGRRRRDGHYLRPLSACSLWAERSIGPVRRRPGVPGE